MIELRQVRLSRGQPLLHLTVGRGVLFALLGPGGAGKSRIVELVTTLVQPPEGQVMVAGHDALAHPARARRAIGVVLPQTLLDLELSIEENLAFQAMMFGWPRPGRTQIRELLASLGVSADERTPVRELSPVLLWRVDLARALVGQPQVLVLDDPGAALEGEGREEVWGVLRALGRERGTTVLLATRHERTAARCDRVALLHEGKVVAEGTPAELRAIAGPKRVVLGIRRHGLAEAALAVRQHFGREAQRTPRGLELSVESREPFLQRLSSFPVPVASVIVREPSLEDALVVLTSHLLDPPSRAPRERRG